MSSKKKAAGNATSQAAKKNTTTKIIAVPLDVVNMSDKEIIDAAVDRLHQQDKEANYDRCGQIMHKAVRDALCEFCRQNAEFARAICQTDKPSTVASKRLRKAAATEYPTSTRLPGRCSSISAVRRSASKC